VKTCSLLFTQLTHIYLQLIIHYTYISNWIIENFIRFKRWFKYRQLQLQTYINKNILVSKPPLNSQIRLG